MEDFYQLILGQGPFWVKLLFFGTAAGLTVFIIANRTYIKQLRSAYETQIAKTSQDHDLQLKLKDDTIELMKIAKAEAQALLQEAAKEALTERNTYRDRLHEEKANHQATLLRLNEAESRPDLGQIITSNAEFNRQIMDHSARMLDAIKNMEIEMKKHSNLCHRSVKLIDIIVQTLVQKKILTEDLVKDLK